jgi:hypothetical protein
MLASQSYMTPQQFYQSNPADKQHMTQKKLQLKTVTAYMCSPQPGNFGLIHLTKQQSQRIADCYALALVSFIYNLRSFFPRNRFSIPVPI